MYIELRSPKLQFLFTSRSNFDRQPTKYMLSRVPTWSLISLARPRNSQLLPRCLATARRYVPTGQTCAARSVREETTNLFRKEADQIRAKIWAVENTCMCMQLPVRELTHQTLTKQADKLLVGDSAMRKRKQNARNGTENDKMDL